MLAALIGGVPAGWALALATPAGALSPSCSQVQRSVTCTFSSTGSEQTVSVPSGVGSVQINAVGAPGGGVIPGLGGTAAATVAVTSGETLYVEVGGVGTGSAGGFNGGRAPGSSPVRNGEGGGGGASDVRTVSGSLASRLVVAAGGGGSGGAGNDSGANAPGGAAGGDGGSGRNSSGDANDKGGGAGLAGMTTAGGAFGAGGAADSGGTMGSDGTAGGSGSGGSGGGGSGGAGGGGGGGYFGGGGGGGGGETLGHQAGGGGGGGGSCFALGAVACGANSSTTPSVTITYTLPDTTAPTIAISSPGANAVYPAGASVPASYSCADEAGGSGLATCHGTMASGSPIDTSTAGPHSFTVTARDNAGNASAQTISYTVLGAPTATISSPAAGGRYAEGQVVHTAFACSEASGGPGIVTCGDSHGTQAAPGVSQGKNATGVLDTSHAGTYAYTVSAGSADGLSGTAKITYTVVAPPLIRIGAPIANHTYDIGQAVPVRYACKDGAGGPGIKSCFGTVKEGRLLNTQSPGTFKFTVTAKSRDGQKTTKTVSYSTVPPAGHAALSLRLATGTVFTDDSVAFSPTGKSNQLLICGPAKGACSSQGKGGNLVIQVPFSKSAPFKKSQHLSLFGGKGESGTLHVYVRGSHNTTETFTWSIAGVLVTHLTVAGSGKGVVIETVNLSYTQLKFQGCRPDSTLC